MVAFKYFRRPQPLYPEAGQKKKAGFSILVLSFKLTDSPAENKVKRKLISSDPSFFAMNYVNSANLFSFLPRGTKKHKNDETGGDIHETQAPGSLLFSPSFLRSHFSTVCLKTKFEFYSAHRFLALSIFLI